MDEPPSPNVLSSEVDASGSQQVAERLAAASGTVSQQAETIELLSCFDGADLAIRMKACDGLKGAIDVRQ
jgi:hypothetical protein